jgi:Flp pilus assembly protein TadG
MVAVAVDIGNVCMVQTEAQAVADAAALAGARGLSSGAAQVQSLAIACAQQNTMNGQKVTLQDSNIVLGTWSPTSRSLTVLTGSAQSQANACQVNVTSTPSTFFARVFGVNSVTTGASATAGAGRWDLVICLDRSASFADDLSGAVAGIQAILSDMNQYSPLSYLGIVTFDGLGYVNAPLQAVGANYSTLNTAVIGIQDCQSGGPPCSGSDLAAGMATAVSLFSAAGYNPPLGTRKAILFISDGAASTTSKCVNSNLSDAQDNALAATEAQNAWTSSRISVYSVLYYHGSDNQTDINGMEALVEGRGQYIQEPDPSQLTADIESMLMNNLSMQLVQ